MDATATQHIKKEIAVLENRIKALKAYVEIQEKSEPQWEVGDIWVASEHSPESVAIIKNRYDAYVFVFLDGEHKYKECSNLPKTKEEMTAHLSRYKYKKIGKLGVVDV